MAIDTIRKRNALLLHYSGDELFQIYQTLNLRDDGQMMRQRKPWEIILTQRKNKNLRDMDFATSNKDKMKQLTSFQFVKYKQAVYCDYMEKEGETMSQIIQIGCLEEDNTLKDI